MKNGCRIEARACLDPLFGFYFAVAVEVGTEVAVPAKAAAWIVAQQQHDEHPQGMFLKIGTGIGGMPSFVEPTFIADADRMGIVVFDVRSGLSDGAECFYIPVLADIKMITCAGESPAQVVCCQVMFRIAAVAAGGGTVDNDEVDESHVNYDV